MESSDRLIVEHHGGVAVATIRDRCPDNPAVEQIRNEFTRLLLDPAVEHVVVDLGGVDYFEANLRGVLVLLWRRLKPRGGRLALCGLSPVMQAHPTLIDFRSVMVITDRLEEAITRVRTDEPEN